MKKATNLVAVEVEENIVKILNDSKLMAFILKPIVERIYNQIVNLEQQQLEAAKIEYEENFKKNKKGSENL